MRLLICAAALAFAAAAGAAPVLKGADLNGRPVAVPDAAGPERTLLLLAFRHEDQDALEAWRNGLHLANTDPDWLEAPLIPVKSPMIQPMILGGMKKRFADPGLRGHMAPLFQDPAPVATAFGLSGQGPAVVVVDRAGKVLARAEGAYDATRAKTLMAALRPGA